LRRSAMRRFVDFKRTLPIQSHTFLGLSTSPHNRVASDEK
jgi:hypothetical protein